MTSMHQHNSHPASCNIVCTWLRNLREVGQTYDMCASHVRHTEHHTNVS